MKTYWDSSCLVEVAIGETKANATFEKEKEKLTRCHALAEVFATLTGGKLGYRVEADQAAETLRSVAGEMTVVELDGESTLNALAKARQRGVRGGGVHDYLHAVAAETGGAKKIYTRNAKDFSPITKLTVAAA